MLELTYSQIYTLIGMVMGLTLTLTFFHMRCLTSFTPNSFGSFITILLFTFLWPLFVVFMAITRPLPRKRV